MIEVVLATRSSGKLRELRPMLEAAGYRPLLLGEVGIVPSAAEEGIEVHDTFEANARAKAEYFAVRCGGRPVLAEDSGLVVPSLGGAPGVHSRRWSGRPDLAGQALDDANNALLLERLGPGLDRSAWYACVAVWHANGREWVGEGRCEGELLRAPRGTGGFGYDPLFLSRDLGKSFGEATAEEKETCSHRGRAIRRVLAALREGR